LESLTIGKKLAMEEIGNQVSQIQPLNKLDITQSPLEEKKTPTLAKYSTTKPLKDLNFSHRDKSYVKSCL